ncbi:hypothetical protein LTR91_023863 [Friedmanniomyces endolithicus]|uniref:Uncharacterized protein n=1 Tax=Friedmanniomyces endolithicus TaxID=329885 RepID=A0AAN6H252_9PEZI|nr:hypothetical protein LTR94_013480 [Friedmanniomyces endolithicus]KAK0770407.1 hypothetical protein LTR59_016530 [Friedmanniomyces endolithicus]KAK0783249.1 hypothetical protein LTR38_013106 [Friedmanniomyces endolithicus]KAK0790052.1 hypothetical protein LTR75_012185 [Friedmanniomyces endolithicus]KAK0828684.1 hypothetical protein LTR03_016524 [Friedmanniomyces endolithicus]
MAHSLARLLLRKGRGSRGDDDFELGKGHPRKPQQQQKMPTSQLHVPEKRESDVNIQPHTDEGGDGTYIGDAYEPARTASEWALTDGRPRPYLDFIKRVSKDLPHLEYLAHWMEVSCAPPKWKFIKDWPANRDLRAAKCSVCVMDFNDGQEVSKAFFAHTATLQASLETSSPSAEKPTIRLVIAEDLSRDLVELLGSTYDIDPLFFLSHISDYLFHNTRDRWVELPDLDVDARQRSHFNVQYLRARYFKTQESFYEAEQESGSFNVLRRLDSDRSRKRLQNTLLDTSGASVTLSRSKTSIWIKPRDNPQDPIIAVLLVDPTVKPGHALWGGYRPFSNTPSMHDQAPVEAPTHKSLYDDVVYWTSRMTAADLDGVRAEPRSICMPIFRLVLADWRTVLKYMATMLGKIEWEFENPHWGEAPSDIDNSLRKLSPWRRNVPYYQGMIAESIDRIFRDLRTAPAPSTTRPAFGIPSLRHDFDLVRKLMDASQHRIETIQTTASNSISIEESRRAVQQNQNLARLTFLATLFIPLSFTSSFLSMSSNFTQSTQTIWLFFAIGLPLTAIALITIDLMHPEEGLILGRWRAFWKRKPTSRTPAAVAPQKVQIGRTIGPWPTNRFDTGFRLEGRS